MCSDSICCCYKGGGGFVKITPSGDTCKRSFGGSQVWVTIVLAAIVIVIMLAGTGSSQIFSFQERKAAAGP